MALAKRLVELQKVSCSVFGTTFNPTGARLGNRVLRQRLRGPALLDYYPDRYIVADTLRKLRRLDPDTFSAKSLHEENRVADIETRRRRGKGTPKKMSKEAYKAASSKGSRKK